MFGPKREATAGILRFLGTMKIVKSLKTSDTTGLGTGVEFSRQCLLIFRF
jgi:hypothetical protein